jgi:hypothetical protein
MFHWIVFLPRSLRPEANSESLLRLVEHVVGLPCLLSQIDDFVKAALRCAGMRRRPACATRTASEIAMADSAGGAPTPILGLCKRLKERSNPKTLRRPARSCAGARAPGGVGVDQRCRRRAACRRRAPHSCYV